LSKTQKKKLTSTAIIVMLSITISRLTGFLREILIPNILGTNEVGDAYVIAFRITGLLYDMLVGGAIAAALIPVLSGYLAKDEEEDGWKAVSTFINVIMIVMSMACFVGMIFAPQIVSFANDVFDMKLKSLGLSIRLTRILFPSVAFMMLAGLTNGVLNSYNKIAATAYGPSIYNLGSALSILLLSRFGVEFAAFGVMISAMIYFLFQLSFAFKYLKFFKFKIHLKHPGFIRLLKLALPSMAASSIVQINIITTTFFVPFFGEGNVTAFQTADRIWQMPYGIFAQGMGMAVLPMLSANLALGHIEEYRNNLLKALKTVLFLTIPSAVGFVMLNAPIISVFKISNKFGNEAALNAGNILMFFSIALISQSIVTIINRAYYANNDTKTPLIIGTSTMIINVILSYILRHTTIGVAGMALAYSTSSTLNSILLLTVLNKKMKGLHLKKLLLFMSKVFISALIMGGVLFVVKTLIPFNDFSKTTQLFLLFIFIIFGVVSYFISSLIIRIDEAKTAMTTIKNKLARFKKNA